MNEPIVSPSRLLSNAPDLQTNNLFVSMKASPSFAFQLRQWDHEIQQAIIYSSEVERCCRNGTVPRPPINGAEMAVVLFEYPHLIVEWVPLLLHDTPCRRAAEAFVAEVGEPY